MVTKQLICKYDGIVNINVKFVDGKRRAGTCKRCGKCCQQSNCQHLIYETVDDQVAYRCDIYSRRPLACALWPMPEDEQPDGCGFFYEDI